MNLTRKILTQLYLAVCISLVIITVVFHFVIIYMYGPWWFSGLIGLISLLIITGVYITALLLSKYYKLEE